MFNVGAPPSVFINESRNSNHSILIQLVGTKSNRSAIGTQVSVTVGKVTQIAEVRGGGSYLSSNDQRLHFGLGSASSVQKIEIRWPSGAKDEFENLSVDCLYRIVEGRGIQKTGKLGPTARLAAISK